MKEQYYVALDIGSSSVKIVVGEKFHDGVNIIGTGQTFTDGVSKGMIRDFDLAKSGIIDTVKKAELIANIDIDEVFLKVPITNSNIIFETETLRFSGRDTEIDGELIEELLENIRFKEISEDQEIVTVFPVSFIVDDLHEVEDPKGIIARESLTVNAGIIAVDRTLFLNMGNCAAEAGLNIIDVTSDAYNYTHILTESEIELGSVVMDIGADLTQYAYYKDGALRYTGIIPAGGNTITQVIANEFNTDFHYANRAKEQYGHAFYDRAPEGERVVFPQNSKDEDLEISAKDLSDVIEVTLEDMFMEIFEDLARAGINDISGGFVVTGGTANMRGVRDLLLDIVSEKVRIHIPTQMGARKPEFSSAIATIESGIRFDELLDYVTIDNHESDYDEAEETIEEEKQSIFPSLFKERKEQNKNRDVAEVEEYYIEPSDETHEDDSYIENEEIIETSHEKDESPKEKEKSDFGGFMKKVFKNLFE
ncbi:cell division protein FtsA [Nosocomiicoccus ampullae]|uniref:Cell division protein FtsA n=1 Tax=Nosocomiicoccus ampullae TaxID=489910 RepID=A0A9Q2CZS1_9STAP|nr:cell division protein FtsA [Nosocomiicoccus ampullae]MBB5176155.1 cell division protein FtsA [Nosocomiicoccus ampullae]QYA47326.1 cell division protein FtsA [Nosocomiicoccus ampullae]